MARRGENIRRRKDGRWEGRYKAFDERKGRDVYRSLYGRDYGKLKEKLCRVKASLMSQKAGGESALDGNRGGNGDGSGGDVQKGFSMTGRLEGKHPTGSRDDAGKKTGEVCRFGRDSARDGNGDDTGKKIGTACRSDGKEGWNGNGGEGGESSVLFSQVAGEWLSEVFGRRKYSTYIKYDAVYRGHLADIVGSCGLCAETGDEMREKISDHLSKGGMSESLQKSVVCVANQILAYANQRYSAGVSLMERSYTGAKKKTAGTFSRAEQAKLLARIHERMGDPFKATVLLCLHAGLRLGELCALRWSDIDFDGMTLTVNRTVQRIAVPGCGTRTVLSETAPKSESSRRTIPLTSEMLEILSRLKGGQPYVFGGKKPLEPRTMQYRFQKILREAGVDRRNFHALRHTFATNCVENGMDAKSLSEILGHSDVKITLNRYVHPTMDSKRKQLGGLADFYGQICGQAA